MNPVSLFVENRAEELMLERVFADYVRKGQVRVVMCWEASSAVSLAESSLLRSPATAVAVVLNCAAQNPDEFRIPVESILGRSGPSDSWLLALAVPDMTTWLRSDANFNAALTAARPTVPPSKIDIAVFFKNWFDATSGRIVDRAAIEAENVEFEKLARFIRLHTVAPSRVAG